jgi:hypothetical protein
VDEEGDKGKGAPGSGEIIGVDEGVDGGVRVCRGGFVRKRIVLGVPVFAWFAWFRYDTEWG